MTVCVDEDGNNMCQSHEYLQQGQIASYFSRPAIMAKVPASKRQTIDDADLETVVAYLNAVETIEFINHGVQALQFCIFVSYLVCMCLCKGTLI